MREVNFSIPNVNKAAVHITTTLYDRRALDCTSTLPLINSLNHLAYLTTSSARIRDILTVDGGVERLVCILKEGRSKDNMEMWKWNLAFQCVVNIGVRGSEAVRTRVVEADIVPVIATILGNYIQVVDRQKAKADAEAEAARRNGLKLGSSSRSMNKLMAPREPGREHNGNRSSFFERAGGTSDYRQTRRQAPPPSLDIPQPFSQTFQNAEHSSLETTPTPQGIVTSPPERTMFTRPQLHHHNRSHDSRGPFQRTNALQPPTTAVPSMDATDGFSLRPVRDVDRLPSMMPTLHTGITSNPESPTTPVAPQPSRVVSPLGQRLRRPSIRHQMSTSEASEDTPMEDNALVDTTTTNTATQADAQDEVQSQTDAQVLNERDHLLQPETTGLSLTIPVGPETQDNDTVSITQTSPLEPLQINGLNGIVDGPLNSIDNLGGAQPNPAAAASPAIPLNAYPNLFLRNATSITAAQAAIPRDEDVLMSLQLLAYISKYCDLRQYFQATHLVPRLKIDRELQMMENGNSSLPSSPTDNDDEDMEEFLQPDDYNISPLVEKFTVRHHSKDMQYWACVVMRNLCRKDESKGGIRQCAWYKCGRWEEYVRQFAKCRRCRRTKYCSKECQRESWPSHRHWCHTPPPQPA